MNYRNLSNKELAKEAELAHAHRRMDHALIDEMIYRLRRAADQTLEPCNNTGERIGDVIHVR